MAAGATYTAELQATVDSLKHDLAMESVRSQPAAHAAGRGTALIRTCGRVTGCRSR